MPQDEDPDQDEPEPRYERLLDPGSQTSPSCPGFAAALVIDFHPYIPAPTAMFFELGHRLTARCTSSDDIFEGLIEVLALQPWV